MALKGEAYLDSKSKRRLDIIGGCALAGVAAPVAAALGLEAMVEYRRFNPFFTQRRIGMQGRGIMMFKFESLHDKGDPTGFNGGSCHPGASAVGRLIRRCGVDELPQLANVIRGDISLVGIRPVPEHFMEYYESFAGQSLYSEWRECYDKNLGLTGEGQLFAKQYPNHSAEVIRRQMEIEIDATEHASLKNDMRIIASTPALLLKHLLVSSTRASTAQTSEIREPLLDGSQEIV